LVFTGLVECVVEGGPGGGRSKIAQRCLVLLGLLIGHCGRSFRLDWDIYKALQT
jgi:hypothetical protein